MQPTVLVVRERIGISAAQNARAHRNTHTESLVTDLQVPAPRGNRHCYGHRKTPLLRCNGYVLTRGSHWAGPCWNALTPAPRHAAPSDLSFKLHKNQLVFIVMLSFTKRHPSITTFNDAKSRLSFLTWYWKQFNRRCKEKGLKANS
jgi:hypothetical protein